MLRLEPKCKPVLEDAIRSFAQWRGGRTKVGRIPNRLWAVAIQLLESHTAEDVGHSLGLNPDNLARRGTLGSQSGNPNMGGKKPKSPKAGSETVSFHMSDLFKQTMPGGDWQLVIQQVDGPTVKLIVPSQDRQDVVALVRQAMGVM